MTPAEKLSRQRTYRQKLNNGCMYVKFLKKDNTVREMYCTRSAEIIKSLGYEPFYFAKGRAYNQEKKYVHQVFVCDLENGESRIINLDTIQEERYARTVEQLNIPQKQTETPIAVDTTLTNPDIQDKAIEDLFSE